MKLAFCLFNYFPFGGLQRDFLRIATACQQRGHDVHVFTRHWDGEKPTNLTIHELKITSFTNHGRNQAFATAVKNKLDHDHFDLVIGFNKMPHLDLYYAADVCYQARVRELRGHFYRSLPRYRQLVALEKSVFLHGKQTDIMLISPLQQPAFEAYYHTEKNRFHVLPPGISKDRIAPINADVIRHTTREANAIREDDNLILMVGSGFKTKGVDRALRAFAALPETVRARSWLKIIGQDNAAIFEKLAHQLHIQNRVAFLGGRNDVPDFLLAADLLLHPAYHENTGTVLLEALASGLPVLTTAVCGYAHYIETAKAGQVIPVPFEQAALNAALQTMLTSSERQLWRQNAIAFAKQADIYSMPEKAADLIEQVGRKRDSLSAR